MALVAVVFYYSCSICFSDVLPYFLDKKLALLSLGPVFALALLQQNIFDEYFLKHVSCMRAFDPSLYTDIEAESPLSPDANT